MSSKDESNRPSVGVATVVIKDGLVLIGKDTRKGDAVFGVPGGHWESGETSLPERLRKKVEFHARISNLFLYTTFIVKIKPRVISRLA